jgi:serine protease inhibitor ecotin
VSQKQGENLIIVERGVMTISKVDDESDVFGIMIHSNSIDANQSSHWYNGQLEFETRPELFYTYH